jgi:ABC-2 type transport system ATP-binding protein
MISVRSLTKRFGSLTAVDAIDLDVPEGEFLAFLGPNAAGKTTTIKMLSGLLRPTSGEVRIGGYDMHKEPEKAKAMLAYVPDFPFLYEKLSCKEFMQFVGEIYRMDSATVEKDSEELFERFHLADYRHELTENLSHGTRQRLVISSALLHKPRLLIIDEPMVGLDPMHARIVKQEFRERSNAGMTIFLSTHQLSVAEEVADRIAIINHGRVIASGTVEELRSQTDEKGALEKVFLSLIDAEDAGRERTAKA